MEKLKKLGLEKGEPDLRLHWSHAEPWLGQGQAPRTAKTLYLECKIKPNKPTPTQAGCMVDLTNLGFPCEVVYSFEDALAAFKLHGVPMRAKVT